MNEIDIEFSDSLEEITRSYVTRCDPYTMIACLASMAGIVGAVCDTVDFNRIRPIIRQSAEDGFNITRKDLNHATIFCKECKNEKIACVCL